MKRISVLALALMMVSSVSFAAGSMAPQGHLVLGIGGLVGVPASSNAGNGFDVGFGGEGFVGYAFNDSFTVGLVSGYDSYGIQRAYVQNALPVTLDSSTAVSGSMSYVPLLVEAKCSFGSGKVRPYGILGAGLAFNNGSFTATEGSNSAKGDISETDLLLAPGLGVDIALSEKADLFIQGRVDIDFTSNNGSTPATLTLDGSSSSGTANLTGDNPTLYIPFEVGVNFSL
jgi:Outer membrane protein beta-barrel domain